jgi:hypothetical protein
MIASEKQDGCGFGNDTTYNRVHYGKEDENVFIIMNKPQAGKTA